MEVEANPEGYKILIVDDVISNVLLLKALLKSEKYKVITAENGLQALDLVKTEMPDLILLDVMMPGMSGFDVSKELKASPEYHEIPILFLTALNSHEDIVKGFQLGANDFITKPFNKNELLIRIRHQVSLIAAKRVIIKQTEELRSIIIGRDKLYSVIAHDLRGPLGSIKMVLNMLIENLNSTTIGQDMFDVLCLANQTTEDTFALLDNLLKWTKSQIGRLNVVYQHSNLVDIIKDGIEIFQTAAELKGISIKFETTEKCSVYADADMIKTIVRNILSNAVKFSNPNGEIMMTIDITDEHLAVVSITNFGAVIKEEDKGKLLKPETHFSTFGTGNEEGSGLGLLLCQDFVHKNGGKLWFDSSQEEGTTFRFSVPKSELQ
ncbi:MAG: response regulator [Rikenellaceae bacterium]